MLNVNILRQLGSKSEGSKHYTKRCNSHIINREGFDRLSDVEHHREISMWSSSNGEKSVDDLNFRNRALWGKFPYPRFFCILRKTSIKGRRSNLSEPHSIWVGERESIPKMLYCCKLEHSYEFHDYKRFFQWKFHLNLIDIKDLIRFGPQE